jgi:hypothetical protein
MHEAWLIWDAVIHPPKLSCSQSIGAMSVCETKRGNEIDPHAGHTQKGAEIEMPCSNDVSRVSQRMKEAKFELRTSNDR